MSTVVKSAPSNLWRARWQVPQPAIDRRPIGQALWGGVRQATQTLLGAALFVLGVALASTLWLLALGLPLGFLGVALMAAPDNTSP
jgi:hypothetical protein